MVSYDASLIYHSYHVISQAQETSPIVSCLPMVSLILNRVTYLIMKTVTNSHCSTFIIIQKTFNDVLSAIHIIISVLFGMISLHIHHLCSVSHLVLWFNFLVEVLLVYHNSLVT